MKLSSYMNRDNYKQLLLDIVFILFVIQLLRTFIHEITLVVEDYAGWRGLSDYYVNYQGGFVRRGLMGEMLFFMARNFSIHTEWAIKIFTISCFLTLCWFFIKSFMRKGYALYILPLCFFFGLPHFSNKDYLMICVLVLNLWVYKSSCSSMIKFLVINASSIFVILSHEVYGIIALPVLCLLLFGEYRNVYKEKSMIKPVVVTLLFLLPCILTMFLVARAHGDRETAQIIWDSWMKVFNHSAELNPLSPIGAIGFDATYNMNQNIGINFLTVSYGVPSWAGWIVTWCAVYYLSINYLSFFSKQEQNYSPVHKTALSSFFVFQFICFMPLFLVLSCDYGRLSFYLIASSFAVFLIIPPDQILNMFPVFFVKCVDRINDGLSKILPPSGLFIVVLMLLIGMSPTEFSMGAILKTNVLYNIYALFMGYYSPV